MFHENTYKLSNYEFLSKPHAGLPVIHGFMSLDFGLRLAATLLCAALALVAIFKKRRSLAVWCFAVGMLVLAIESVLSGITLQAASPDQVVFWRTMALLAQSFIPGVWLCFSLTYSRANYAEFLLRWRPALITAFLVPLAVVPAVYWPSFEVVAFQPPTRGWEIRFDSSAKILNGLVLVAITLILMNLERTFRAAVGTMRWRIKFIVLGLGVIFGARIYTASQALLYSGDSLGQFDIKNAALLIGCLLMAIGYARTGFSEIDVYPSRAVLHTSVTLLLAGAYLFVVGVLAQLVTYLGDAAAFPFQALVVLLGVAFLAVLLLSDRMRQSVEVFVSRHFKRPQHDFRQIWTECTRSMSTVLDEIDLCSAASRLLSETFNALSVSVWLLDEQRERLVRKSSTIEQGQPETGDAVEIIAGAGSPWVGPSKLSQPFDLEKAKDKWASSLRVLSAGRFRDGGGRVCVPLVTAEHWLGVIVLADRVRGINYSVEEMDLLRCIGDHVAAGLLNIQLTKAVLERKELAAFQTISTFFVHDLKNAASTLGLTLRNFRAHFDDPAFREDAFRGIASTAGRINDLISRMSTLRKELQLVPATVDLNLLVTKVLKNLNCALSAEVVTDLQPLPSIVGDQEKLEGVMTNLLLNARDAVEERGHIIVETSQRGDGVVLSVSDNGCGMTPEFIRDSLFRPFQTTKKKGLGIGMFQARMIINAHHGNIHVTSAPGAGTTFRITLPITLESE